MRIHSGPASIPAFYQKLEAGALPTTTQPIRICDIGCIIAAHSGLGTVAAFFLGDPHALEN